MKAFVIQEEINAVVLFATVELCKEPCSKLRKF